MLQLRGPLPGVHPRKAEEQSAGAGNQLSGSDVWVSGSTVQLALPSAQLSGSAPMLSGGRSEQLLERGAELLGLKGEQNGTEAGSGSQGEQEWSLEGEQLGAKIRSGTQDEDWSLKGWQGTRVGNGARDVEDGGRGGKGLRLKPEEAGTEAGRGNEVDFGERWWKKRKGPEEGTEEVKGKEGGMQRNASNGPQASLLNGGPSLPGPHTTVPALSAASWRKQADAGWDCTQGRYAGGENPWVITPI